MKKTILTILLLQFVFIITFMVAGCTYDIPWLESTDEPGEEPSEGTGDCITEPSVFQHFDYNQDGYCDGNFTEDNMCNDRNCTVFFIKQHLVTLEDGTYYLCTPSVDAHDYVCDLCGHRIPDHYEYCWDYDRDGKCDYCQNVLLTIPEGTHICIDLWWHDGICDECGKVLLILPCRNDKDGDGKCDICGKDMQTDSPTTGEYISGDLFCELP